MTVATNRLSTVRGGLARLRPQRAAIGCIDRSSITGSLMLSTRADQDLLSSYALKFFVEGDSSASGLSLSETVGQPDILGGASLQMATNAQWEIEVSNIFPLEDVNRSSASLKFIIEGGSSDHTPSLTEDVDDPDELGELSFLLLVDKNVNERAAARGLMNLVESFLSRRDFVSLNRLLQKVDAAEVSVRFAVALLRSTFRVADYLPAWRTAVDRAHDAFAAKGEDAEWLLAGLRA